MRDWHQQPGHQQMFSGSIGFAAAQHRHKSKPMMAKYAELGQTGEIWHQRASGDRLSSAARGKHSGLLSQDGATL
jgi:hypothetical protein